MAADGQIKALEKTAVHKICSGQVIVNLETAVKELVENSLDANADSIEIRVRDYGKESIEVVDNGYGVEEKNYAGLALKHHTSKIRDFVDLTGVATFGFRGEALSSICALSDVTITTRHVDVSVGHRIEFDHSGLITKKSPCPREPGTTVLIRNIFFTLPVRHKEFTKNAKKEFGKMVRVLTAYCLVNTGLKLHCSHITREGKKSTILNLNGNASVYANVTNVFGSVQVESLREFVQIEPKDDIVTTESEENTANETRLPEIIPFRISGFISNIDHGKGRRSPDRQFHFINGRPCDLSKLSRLINDVYRQYNRDQYPFFVLDVKTLDCAVDVNVTPDKRQILMENEKLLLTVVRLSLSKMYESLVCSYPANQPVIFNKSPLIDTSLKENTTSSMTSKIEKFLRSPRPSVLNQTAKQSTMTVISTPKSESLSEQGNARNSNARFEPYCPESNHVLVDENLDFTQNSHTYIDNKLKLCQSEDRHDTGMMTIEGNNLSGASAFDESTRKIRKIDQGAVKLKYNDGDSKRLSPVNTVVTFIECNGGSTCEQYETKETGTDGPADLFRGGRRKTNVRFSLTSLRDRNQSRQGRSTEAILAERHFRATISTSDNQQAEQELRKQISKQSFTEMHVLGQFNLGFIVAKLRSELFIIDQHASDEKYNFETLQMVTKLDSQTLVTPEDLQLSSLDESLLIENIQIFRMNGFEFQVDPDAPNTKKVKLISRPVSRRFQLGKGDIDELLFMLRENPGEMCRPSRIREMFASRACRKSVMIGTALSQKEMKKLLVHMSEIDQPWNCPHGRPTMRHLINLNMISR